MASLSRCTGEIIPRPLGLRRQGQTTHVRAGFVKFLLTAALSSCGTGDTSLAASSSPTMTALSFNHTTFADTPALRADTGAPLNLSVQFGAQSTDPVWGKIKGLTVNIKAGALQHRPLHSLFPGCTVTTLKEGSGNAQPARITYLTTLHDQAGTAYHARIEGTSSVDGMRVAQQTILIYASAPYRAQGNLTCPGKDGGRRRDVLISLNLPTGWSPVLMLEATPKGTGTTDVFLKHELNTARYPIHWVPDGTFD